jgi:hypothetical protein
MNIFKEINKRLQPLKFFMCFLKINKNVFHKTFANFPKKNHEWLISQDPPFNFNVYIFGDLSLLFLGSRILDFSVGWLHW